MTSRDVFGDRTFRRSFNNNNNNNIDALKIDFAGICLVLKTIGLALGPRVYIGHQAVTNHSIELLTRLHLFDIQVNAVKTAIL